MLKNGSTVNTLRQPGLHHGDEGEEEVRRTGKKIMNERINKKVGTDGKILYFTSCFDRSFNTEDL